MLNDNTCKRAQPQAKPYKLSDQKGLSLLVHSNGSKYWIWRHRTNGKDTTTSIGIYVDTTGQYQTSLKEAREKVEELRVQLRATGSIKATDSHAPQVAPTFIEVAEEWFNKNKTAWSEKHGARIKKTILIHITDAVGNMPINTVTPQDLLKVLRSIEGRGAIYTARRAVQYWGSVFTYGIICQYCTINPALGLATALAPHVPQEYAYLDWKDLPAFFKEMKLHSAMNQVSEIAFWVLAYTGTRTQETLCAKWAEFDFEAKVWTIPAERMKNRLDHVVPLSRQVIGLLESLKPLTGELEHLFPNRNRVMSPMSDMVILRAIERAGYHKKMTGHGLRKAFSTHANESGKWSEDAIERQLAHVARNRVRAAYNKAKMLPERTELMQWYADELDKLRIE